MEFLKRFKNWVLDTKETTNPEWDKIIQRTYHEHKTNGGNWYDIKLSKNTVFTEEVDKWPTEDKIDFIVYCTHRVHEFNQKSKNTWTQSHDFNLRVTSFTYIQKLLSKRLELKEAGVEKLIQTFLLCQANAHSEDTTGWPLKPLLNQLAKQYKGLELPAGITKSLELLKNKINKERKDHLFREQTEIVERIEALIFRSQNGEEAIKPTWFTGQDEFSAFANPILEVLPLEQRRIWFQLLPLAQKAKGGKPSQRYLKNSKGLIDELGVARFKKQLIEWFQFVIDLKETIIERKHKYLMQEYTYIEAHFLSQENIDALKGFVWMCAHFHDTLTLRTIRNLAERCYKKIPSRGPAAVAIGNACFYTLFHSKGLEGVGHLSKLKLKIRQANAHKLIDKYLGLAAEKKGISISALEELAVEDFGIENGEHSRQFGAFIGLIRILGVGKTNMIWITPENKEQKSIPAQVKKKYPKELKKFKELKKEIEKSLTAQRDRIDRLFRDDRKWKLEAFQKFYQFHGLVGYLAKDIIWTFMDQQEKVHAILRGARWTKVDGSHYEPQPDVDVSLWHPAIAQQTEVEAWRNFLLENQIKQPLKQAYREIYLLTDAERNTQSYSNRMASHILKQHQFNSLAKGRAWKYSLLGAYDDGRQGESARLELPAFGLRAEFWVLEVTADDAFNDVGIWNYVATDQVRFLDQERNQVIDLEFIPPVPFSEVMRDVDLFVGVASIGNDPNWRDSEGAVDQYLTYWNQYSFGDLSGIGKNRKAVLERLLPRLKIKSVAKIEGRFLVVEGKLRTYKIHLGSTNILMSPNDQYLCIVPDRSVKKRADNVFLPFEGDNGLSVIISKAILLANDDRITDPSIVSQIIGHQAR